MKKSVTTQELVNVFPPNSKIRTDDQSIGFQTFNALAQPIERMEKQLVTMEANEFLVMANLDEVDVLYKVKLPTTFDFNTDNTDPSLLVSLAPTVSGIIDDTAYLLTAVPNNDLKAFWYEAVPNRIDVTNTTTGDHNLIDALASEFPVSGIFEHHLVGGYVWIETIGGIEYIKSEDNRVKRARVIISGKTRKGTLESETLIFPWDMKQRTSKEWKEIYDVDVHDMEDDVLVEVRSADFSEGPYLSPWNLRHSENRKKIDEFWDFGDVSGVHTLDRVEYLSDEWQQLILGFSDKDTKESWELLDTGGIQISGVDLALQPFSDRAWVVSTDTLYCYDTRADMVSGISLLADRTQGADIAIELEFPSVILGEVIQFLPWHARPLQEIIRYRIWYQTPAGTKYGLLNGVQVAYTSDFWIREEQKTTRSIENYISIPADERGEYLIVFEAVYRDETTQTAKRLVPVNYKNALCEFELSSHVAGNVMGIDFDADQKLWVYTSSGYYQIDPHYDIMLIDYEEKKLYLREDYDEVEVY